MYLPVNFIYLHIVQMETAVLLSFFKTNSKCMQVYNQLGFVQGILFDNTCEGDCSGYQTAHKKSVDCSHLPYRY